MKEESRKILDYLISKHSLRIGHYDGYSEQDEAWNLQEKKICDFLKSIPEIESHLCRGGYIQDKNGTPCCDGDKVINESILNDEPMIGTLYWSKEDARFYFKYNDTLYSLSKNLEKVKSQSKWDKIKKVTK